MSRAALAALFLIALAARAAAGDLVPTDPRFGPLRVKLHRVETTIDNQVAITRVTQVFANDNDAQLEAIYMFPTPGEATIIDFSMTINGKVMRGELLEKNRARDTYERIVRRAKDPGLLEQVGKNVFRMRVFPIAPRSEQRIELTYVERITYENGRCTWRYPMRVPGSKADSKTDEMELTVRIFSQIPIKEVASATHPFDVARASDRQAAATLRRANADLNKDVEVTYTLAREKSGFDVVAHRAQGDGTFLLLVTPAADLSSDAPKDMTFVFDTSGSMEGEKMRQAKAALRFCVAKLRPRDRFNIIRFSTDVEPFRPAHVDASEENLKAAQQYVDRLEAMGGTNIQDALLRALAHKPEKGRPHMIVFLTDGMPTVGETDAKAILRRILVDARDEVRIFTFGVGNDVNRGLLEDTAEATRAIASFVAPAEDIEVSVSALQRRIVAPVISSLEIDWGGADVHSVYPKRITDVYAGVQLLIAGRYAKPGTHRVTLRGMHAGQAFSVTQEVTFPEKRDSSEPIKYIWGARKIADLLDTIRRSGENSEIVADVVRLSREYRVATPYTSFLVLEDEAAYDREGIDRKAPPSPPDQTAKASGGTGKVYVPGKNEDHVYKKDAEESDHNETVDDEEFQKPKGDALDFVSEKPHKGKGTYDTIGQGGGGGGRYGGRRAIAPNEAVLASLKWLAKRQNADGSWSTGKDADVAATALSLLAFLGAGYTHLARDVHDGVCYGDVVKKALVWLMSRQDPEGCLAPRSSPYMLDHAMAALALAEAYGITGSNLFRDNAQKAIDFLIGAQNPKSGWGSFFRDGRSSALNTCWAVMALDAARLSGLAFEPAALDGARAFVNEKPEGVPATLVRILLDPRDARLGEPPKGDDVVSWHLATAALRLRGSAGDAWKQWGERTRDAVLGKPPADATPVRDAATRALILVLHARPAGTK